MTMARAKQRAASATVEASAAPSRRCRCQSSGRRRLIRSIATILLCALDCLAIQLVLRGTGDARRQFRRLARRQRLQQELEHGIRIEAAALRLLGAGLE